MSNSVTNVEIEDVLSSIRRLVSEEGRPHHGATPQAAERLVLSPALRVPEDEEDPQPDPPMMLMDAADLPDDQDEARAPVATLVLGQDDAAEDLPEVADWAETRIAEPADAAPTVDLSEAPDDVVETVLTDLPDDPVPEDLAEAEQIAALRASLTDLLDHDEAEEAGEAPGLAADYADWTVNRWTSTMSLPPKRRTPVKIRWNARSPRLRRCCSASRRTGRRQTMMTRRMRILRPKTSFLTPGPMRRRKPTA